MTRKIFFSDLDGTLLNDKKEITPKTLEAVKAFMEKGNILAISSGRPLDSIKEVVLQHNLMHENLYCIGFNGALIYHFNSGKKIIENTLSIDMMTNVANIASESGIYCHAYNDTHILCPRISDELNYYTKSVHLPVSVIDNYPYGLTTPSCKILCIELSGGDALNSLATKLMKAMPEDIQCVKSNDYLLEVFPKSAGKGSAVIELCEKLGISIDNSYAAGDEQNDISMLTAAHTGIAMINGRDITKASADIITTMDNNHDGLCEFFI